MVKWSRGQSEVETTGSLEKRPVGRKGGKTGSVLSGLGGRQE